MFISNIAYKLKYIGYESYFLQTTIFCSLPEYIILGENIR